MGAKYGQKLAVADVRKWLHFDALRRGWWCSSFHWTNVYTLKRFVFGTRPLCIYQTRPIYQIITVHYTNSTGGGQKSRYRPYSVAVQLHSGLTYYWLKCLEFRHAIVSMLQKTHKNQLLDLKTWTHRNCIRRHVGSPVGQTDSQLHGYTSQDAVRIVTTSVRIR